MGHAQDIHLSALGSHTDIYSNLSEKQSALLRRNTSINVHLMMGKKEVGVVRLPSDKERIHILMEYASRMMFKEVTVVVINPYKKSMAHLMFEDVFPNIADEEDIVFSFDTAIEELSCVLDQGMLAHMLDTDLEMCFDVLSTHPCTDTSPFFDPDLSFAVEVRLYRYDLDDNVRLPGGEVMGHKFKGNAMVLPVLVYRPWTGAKDSSEDWEVAAIFDIKSLKARDMPCFMPVFRDIMDILKMKTVTFISKDACQYTTPKAVWTCLECENPATKVCVGCGVARYCSEKCCKIDWRRHKPYCKYFA